MSRPPVTLQISLAPSDYAHARYLLAHQVATWRGQVDEILLSIDLHRSGGRFSARWAEGRDLIRPLAEAVPGARVVAVDYAEPIRRAVAAQFFLPGTGALPAKDYRGGPFYSYFFALQAARHDHVLHLDSDMFFGGRSGSWLDEALEVFRTRGEVLFTAPLPGPPAPGGLRQLDGRRVGSGSPAYDFAAMSTRLFLVDRRRFEADFGRLSLRPPRLRARLQAWLDGNPAADLPEHLMTTNLRRRGFCRHEFLGQPPGMWSLHPPYRCAEFYRRLPELIDRVERGDLPTGQYGDHDLNDSFIDWTEARAAMHQNRWWRRLAARWQTQLAAAVKP